MTPKLAIDGGTPVCVPTVFADTRPESYNVLPAGVRAALTKRTRAIMVAHGTTWRGKRSGAFGTLTAFSLMSGKHHTSGG